ncbi:MAG: hypothetical protein ACTIAI_00945, partial [Pseudolactococcus laudensis]
NHLNAQWTPPYQRLNADTFIIFYHFNTKKPPFQVILLRVPLKTAFAAAVTRRIKCFDDF